MNKLILISLLVLNVFGSMSVSYWCECKDHTVEKDCNNVVDCLWANSACGIKTCSSFATNTCELTMACALNSAGACETAGACSNYSATNQLDCMIKKGDCAASATAINGMYTCATYTKATCSALTVATCKNNFEGENKFCWPNAAGTACQVYSMDSCTGLPMDVCAQLGCDASGTTCAANKCSSFTSAAACTVANDGIWGKIQILCKWSGTTCVDRVDVTDLTADTCSLNTNGSYYWANSACTQCVAPTDTSSNSIMLTIFVFIFAMLI